jgi:NADPH:quinone reductase-like Zn-dependent oxidoreductase
MKAFAITARDTQPAVQDVPQPEPAPGEVLVEVEAASVNGFDLSVAAGYVWDMIPHEFPVVLGRDLVGTVTAVGDGVTTISVGDRVAGVIPGMALSPKTGSLAEYVALPVDAVAVLPEGVSTEAAATTGLAGVAALDSLDALDIQAGDTVLISGATGGVGSIALQLALAAGATVIATGRPGPEAEYVSSLGAQHVVDWSGDLAEQVKAIAPQGVDKALHAAGDPAAVGATLRPGAIVASPRSADNAQLGRDDVTAVQIMAAATGEKVARLLEHVAAGGLRVNVETTVPLDRAHEAHAAFADGTLGKVLVAVK